MSAFFLLEEKVLRMKGALFPRKMSVFVPTEATAKSFSPQIYAMTFEEAAARLGLNETDSEIYHLPFFSYNSAAPCYA